MSKHTFNFRRTHRMTHTMWSSLPNLDPALCLKMNRLKFILEWNQYHHNVYNRVNEFLDENCTDFYFTDYEDNVNGIVVYFSIEADATKLRLLLDGANFWDIMKENPDDMPF